MRKAAQDIDKLEMGVIENLLGMHVPLHGEGLGWECPLQLPIQGLDGRSFQHWVIRQPIKMGGLGIRSKVETSPAAFIGSLEESLPHFSGEGGVCPQLEHVIGDWSGQEDKRWQHLLESGCRNGQELRSSWATLQEEARGCSSYLGQDLQGHLAVPVEGAGNGSVDGSTRRYVTQQREELRGGVLQEALSRLSNATLRPVRAWLNRDKLSTSWLQCLPGPNGLNSQVFTEALAVVLCMPSPTCKERVGAAVGRRTVDPF